jgi:hypothetical protein
MYIITARRITSGELLKYRKGLRIARGYGNPLHFPSQFALTLPSDPILPSPDGFMADVDPAFVE